MMSIFINKNSDNNNYYKYNYKIKYIYNMHKI